MRVYRCDRCEKIYERSGEDKVPVTLSFRYSHNPIPIEYDLCPECMKLILFNLKNGSPEE